MTLVFYKYEGAGNDFILIDDRNNTFDSKNEKLVAFLCDRRFGIGADGLMLLQNRPGYDFKMIYYNSDGLEGSMCGNGGRCIVAFANYLGLIKDKTHFLAIDGEHKAEVIASDYIKLQMQDVTKIDDTDGKYFVNTGSPHYVIFDSAIAKKDVFSEGRTIRNSPRFKAEGTNVNFVEEKEDHLFIRTYERGVENETLACGTGIVASAISAAYKNNAPTKTYVVKALGGNLKVSFDRKTPEHFTDIWLEGPATRVFKGEIDLSQSRHI